MDEYNGYRKCETHNEDVIAVTLDSQCEEKNRYFCSQCLVSRINDKAIHSNPKAQEKINLIKSEFEQRTKNLTNQNKDVLKQFSQGILNFKGILNDTLDNINSIIQNEIKRLQKVQEQIEDNIKIIDIYNFDKVEAAQKLLEHQFARFRSTINQELTQLEEKLNLDQYLKYLDELKDEVQTLIWYKTDQEPQNENQIATPGLKIFCDKHKTEIIAFDLNPQRTRLNRLVCIYCIEQTTVTYTSLTKVIEKWKKYEELKKSKLLSIQQKHQENKKVIIQQLALITSASQQKNEELTKSLKEFCNNIDGSINKLIGQMGRNWSTQTQKEILDNVDILSKSIQNDEVILLEENYYQNEENDINKQIINSIETIKEACLQGCQKIKNTIKIPNANSQKDSFTVQM